MKKMTTSAFAIFLATLSLLTTVASASRRIGRELFEIDRAITADDITPKRGDSSPINQEKRPEYTPNTFEDTATYPTYNWYFKHTSNGVRPPIPAEMSFIENYGGYYLGKDEPVIYLTFDTGYENGNVEKILDTLKNEDVPAAFFILDNLVLKNTDLVKRMAEEGHTVCNHTAKHRDMTSVMTAEEFERELCEMERIYRESTGYELAKYYRPPEGKFNEDNMMWANELGYKTIFWSFAYADWDNANQMSAKKAMEKILAETHNGEVILLHPTSATNAEILPGLIKAWRDMGYRFGTLDELVGVNDGI